MQKNNILKCSQFLQTRRVINNNQYKKTQFYYRFNNGAQRYALIIFTKRDVWLLTLVDTMVVVVEAVSVVLTTDEAAVVELLVEVMLVVVTEVELGGCCMLRLYSVNAFRCESYAESWIRNPYSLATWRPLGRDGMYSGRVINTMCGKPVPKYAPSTAAPFTPGGGVYTSMHRGQQIFTVFSPTTSHSPIRRTKFCQLTSWMQERRCPYHILFHGSCLSCTSRHCRHDQRCNVIEG